VGEGPPHIAPSVDVWVLLLSVYLCHCWHPTMAPAVGKRPIWTHTFSKERCPCTIPVLWVTG